MRWLAVLAIGSVLVSCTAALSIEEYAEAVQGLGRDYEEETTELQQSLEDDLQREIDLLGRGIDRDDPEAVAHYADQAVAITALRTKAFFAAVGDALSRYRVQLADLEPPRAVASQHDELVSAMDGVLAGLPGLLDGLETAADFDAIDGAVHASGFTDAGPRLSAACTRLEDGLRAEDASVDLRCPS